MGRYREEKRLHKVFIDLENLFHREIMLWVLGKMQVISSYIDVIKDMIDVVTRMSQFRVRQND